MLSYKKRKQCKPVAHANGKVIYINEDDDRGDDVIDSEIELLPVMNPYMDRNVHYIAGPSGSGKSVHATKYTVNYRLMHPNSKIFVFSRLPIPSALSDVGAELIPIDGDLEDLDPIADMDTCLTIFDDIDTIPNDKLKKLVYKIINDILETGRHKKIDIILTSHLVNGNDRKNTRTILNEAHTVTVFPKSGATRQIKYLLKEYYGMDNKQIRDILDKDSRWITIGKNYPMFVLWDHGVEMI